MEKSVKKPSLSGMLSREWPNSTDETLKALADYLESQRPIQLGPKEEAGKKGYEEDMYFPISPPGPHPWESS